MSRYSSRLLRRAATRSVGSRGGRLSGNRFPYLLVCVCLCAAIVVDGTRFSRASAQDWAEDVALVGVNSIFAGLAAGAVQELRDGSFRDGFLRGALGGAIAFGGRRTAAERFWGAGLIGRQINALGASMTRSASLGEPALANLYIPVGPITIHMRRAPAREWFVKLNAYETVWLITALLDERATFDGAASLSAGTGVFWADGNLLVRGNIRMNGGTAGGLIFRRPGMDPALTGNTFAHERVHVLQYDFAQIAWGAPLENWAGEKVPGIRILMRLVQPGVAYPLATRATSYLFSLEHAQRPWEIEAEYLEHR